MTPWVRTVTSPFRQKALFPGWCVQRNRHTARTISDGESTYQRPPCAPARSRRMSLARPRIWSSRSFPRRDLTRPLLPLSQALKTADETRCGGGGSGERSGGAGRAASLKRPLDKAAGVAALGSNGYVRRTASRTTSADPFPDSGACAREGGTVAVPPKGKSVSVSSDRGAQSRWRWRARCGCLTAATLGCVAVWGGCGCGFWRRWRARGGWDR